MKGGDKLGGGRLVNGRQRAATDETKATNHHFKLGYHSFFQTVIR